ncbi:precorrin-3B C(17)-methyltransferase [Pseudomonas sp. Marseille-QA0892]
MTTPASIFVLGNSALPIARQLQACLPESTLHGLAGRVTDADAYYSQFGDAIRARYRAGSPIIALCAAGIVIRTLAPLLLEKNAEPPVLAVAEDGSAVVPLLGGLSGVNELARALADALAVSPAITTSGELRFGTCLLNPPEGYTVDVSKGKRLVSDLLAGATVAIEGDAPWLCDAQLPLADSADRRVVVSPYLNANEGTLTIHPRVVLASIEPDASISAEQIRDALERCSLAPAALAAVLVRSAPATHARAEALGDAFGVPVRFIDPSDSLPKAIAQDGALSLHMVDSPQAATQIGRMRGRLQVVGLGPGAREWMAPAVRRALDEAQDVLGYETYVKMAGPFRSDQQLHASDNREELQRAAHAFDLAALGRRVVMVSSGDPGVFAMAAAVLEALEGSTDTRWHGVQLEILPGITAAMAAASRAGAPLGHDFCLISLSDNLKPWSVIEERLRHATAADLAMAFYNPISKSRPHQLGRALEVIRERRGPDTQVVLGRDIGRPAESLKLMRLGELTPDQVDMRTMVIVGSSQTRRFQGNGREWVYSPRWYPGRGNDE